MTAISLIRKDSLGLQGTIRNAKHHAREMMAFINAMRENVKHLGFQEWKQGHNVHMFVTDDGRQFTLRPVRQDGLGYIGVKLSLRVSRSEEHALIVITDVSEVSNLLATMKLMAVPLPEEAEVCQEQ